MVGQINYFDDQTNLLDLEQEKMFKFPPFQISFHTLLASCATLYEQISMLKLISQVQYQMLRVG